MVERTFRGLFLCLTAVGTLTACNSSGGSTSDSAGASTSDTSSGATDGTSAGTDTSAGPPTTSGVSASGTDTGETTLATDTSAGPGLSTSSSDTSASDSETQSVDASDSDPSTGPGDTSTGGDTSTDGSSSTGGESTSTGDESSTTDDTNGCVPSEQNEVTCDNLDNDCDGNVDNIDMGGDGICDCLNIGILGAQGFAPTSNFEAWLEDQGTAVTRTLVTNGNPGVVTPALLANYDVVLIDRIQRGLSPEEAMALADFVKKDGRGIITLIGYNFDNNNPAPERDRANTVLAPFGLAYVGPYFGNNVIPVFDQNHPIGMGIVDVNFQGGIEPVDMGNQGVSAVFSTIQNQTAGLAHQTAMNGGRVIVWGDEWITFDAVWQGYVDVEDFWVNMFDWVRPQDICASPQ
ncbi:MAG: hypothetical protein JNL82_18670 [Myxococcales bacterium]|nr:hypothetical protein [Myxococcales bacterium]